MWDNTLCIVHIASDQQVAVQYLCQPLYMAMFCHILSSTFTYSAICHGNCQPGKILWQIGRLLPTTLSVPKSVFHLSSWIKNFHMYSSKVRWYYKNDEEGVTEELLLSLALTEIDIPMFGHFVILLLIACIIAINDVTIYVEIPDQLCTRLTLHKL